MMDLAKNCNSPRKLKAFKRLTELKGLEGELFYWRFCFILMENGLIEPWHIVFNSSEAHYGGQVDMHFHNNSEPDKGEKGEEPNPTQLLSLALIRAADL